MFARVGVMRAMEYGVVYHLGRCSCHTWVLSVGRFKHWVFICGGGGGFVIRLCRKLLICIGYYRSEGHGNKSTVLYQYHTSAGIHMIRFSLLVTQCYR